MFLKRTCFLAHVTPNPPGLPVDRSDTHSLKAWGWWPEADRSLPKKGFALPLLYWQPHTLPPITCLLPLQFFASTNTQLSQYSQPAVAIFRHALAGAWIGWCDECSMLFSFCKPLTVDDSIIILQHQATVSPQMLAPLLWMLWFVLQAPDARCSLSNPLRQVERQPFQAQSSEGEPYPHWRLSRTFSHLWWSTH